MSGLADFDYGGFSASLSRTCYLDGRSQYRIAEEAGVTEADLSRARGGRHVSVAKVIALCDWMGCELRDFYRPPYGVKSKACTKSNVKHEVRA